MKFHNTHIHGLLTGSPVRVGILSDTHAYLDPRIAETVKGCDIILHAGDICASEILTQLQQLTPKVIAVAGNNDLPGRWPSDDHIVTQLPSEVSLSLPGGILAMEHGHLHDMQKPSHDDLRGAHPNARVVVYGHTHSQVVDKSHQPWVINPGAAGKVRTRGGPSCLLLTATTQSWHVEPIRFSEQQVT